MAAWRVENMPAKERQKKTKGDKNALIKRRIQDYANRDRVKNG